MGFNIDRKKMKKLLFFVSSIVFFTNLQAEDLSQLLQKLDNKKELYHKTKVESAGLLIVYTRNDLEKMQIYTLKDILKSLRFFTYQERYVGESALSPSGESSVVSSMFRLYIDGHEVSSSIYGSSMLQFGELDLGFIDHVEIYQGPNAISFGNEPGLVTIRIYSKDPKKEGGSTLALQGDSRGSFNSSILYTQTSDNNKNSLLAYALGGKRDRKKVNNGSTGYSKDSTDKTFYAKYNFQNRANLAIGYFTNKKDAFVGVGMAHTPIDPNSIERKHAFINFSYSFPNALQLDLSADNKQHRLLLSDTNKIRIVQNPTPFTYFDGKFSENIFKISVKQNLKHTNGNFIWGLQEIDKSYDIKHMKMDGVNFTAQDGPTNLKIFSAYIEESFNIDQNNLLIGTLKIDNYHDNYNSGSSTEYIARAGYIHLFSPSLSSKFFIARTYLYPGFAYTSTFPNSYFSNPSLGAEHFNHYSTEFKYQSNSNTAKIGGAYATIKDNIVFDSSTYTFINNRQKIDTFRMYAGYSHAFNALNSMSAEIYTTNFMGDNRVKKSSMNGGYIRSINTIGRFDIFNEIIYRSSYTYPLPASIGGPIRIKAGFDYNMGVKWNVNHALTLSLKGENIFGKASQTPIYGLGGTDNIDTRVVFQAGYFF